MDDPDIDSQDNTSGVATVVDTNLPQDTIDVSRKGSRERAMTEKGKDYEKELMEVRFRQLSSSIMKHIKMVSDTYKGMDREMVKLELKNIDKTYVEVNEVTRRLMNVVIDEEVKRFYQEKIGKLEEDIVLAKSSVYEHLSVHSSDTSRQRVKLWLESSGSEKGKRSLAITNLHTTTYPKEEDMTSVIKTKLTSQGSQSSLCEGMNDLKLSSPNTLIAHAGSLHKKLLCQMNVVECLLISEDSRALKIEMGLANEILSQVKEASVKVTRVLQNDDDKVAELIKMDCSESNMFQLKEKVYTKLMEKNADRMSRKSQKSSKSNSTCSSSTHSKLSSLSSRSVTQKARTAGLIAEAENLRRSKATKVHAEAKKKEDEIESQLAHLEAEIIKSEAITKIYEEDYSSKHPGAFMNTSCQKSIIPTINDKVRQNIDNTKAELGNAIMTLANVHAAPQVELDIFAGNPLDYSYFKTTFKDVVERTVNDERGRLNRLLKYTKGEAKELIQPCVHEPDKYCYKRALKLLDNEYGNVHKISCSYLKELREWPIVKTADHLTFRKLYRFLLKCQAFKRDGRLVELDSTDYIRTIIAKLDIVYEDKWSTLAERLRRKKGKEANFNDLVDFVDFHSSRVGDPAYSHSVMRETKSHKVNTSICDEKTVRFAVCPICNDKHHIEDCPSYVSKTVDEKHKLVFKHRLCFACLAPITENHRWKTCTKKMICKTCKGLHPTSLHKVPRDKSPEATLNAAASKDANDDDTSMCIIPV